MPGASLYKDDEDAAITDINVTPFVDVVLVLLVVFMVTAKLIVARGVEIDKPKEQTGGEVPASLRIAVDQKGTIYVNGATFASDAEAVARIAQLASTTDQPKAAPKEKSAEKPVAETTTDEPKAEEKPKPKRVSRRKKTEEAES